MGAINLFKEPSLAFLILSEAFSQYISQIYVHFSGAVKYTEVDGPVHQWPVR